MKTLCLYYYDIHEVFMDQASSFAQLTSERNVGSDIKTSESDVEKGTGTVSTGDSTTQKHLLM
jgi:hypothetical protein